MERILTYAAIVMALLLPLPSWGDEVPASAIESIMTRAQSRGFSRSSIDSLLRIARDAGGKGLYLEPIVDKIEEGLAKNVPPEGIERAALRVAAMVGEVQESLDAFLPSLNRREKKALIEAALEAREQGVSNADVREVLSSVSAGRGEPRGPDRIAQALDGAALLVSEGVEGPRAAQLMKESLSRGFTRDEMKELVADLSHAMGYLDPRERRDMVFSTLMRVRGGENLQAISRSLHSRTVLPEKTLGVGEGLGPSERGKEGIGIGEEEREHNVPRPAPAGR